VIDQRLPGSNAALPADYALQHPHDWLESARHAHANQRSSNQKVEVEKIVGIGVDFTSCHAPRSLRRHSSLPPRRFQIHSSLLAKALETSRR